MIVAVSGMDSLGERAAKMREALQKSQTITDNVVTILGSFDSRLSVLETAMRPTQVSRCGNFFLLGWVLFGSWENDGKDWDFGVFLVANWRTHMR